MAKSLLEHAQFEIERAGLLDHPEASARKVANDTLALVKRFDNQHHTQLTGEYVLDFLQKLCYFTPLTPLTDDPAEWEEFSVTKKNNEGEVTEDKKFWQSLRCPSIVSEDGGKTFTDQATGKSGTSLDHVQAAADRAKEHAELIEKAAKNAEKPAKGSKSKAKGSKITPVNEGEAKLKET